MTMDLNSFDIKQFEKDITSDGFSKMLLGYFPNFLEAAVVLQLCLDFIQQQKENETEG